MKFTLPEIGLKLVSRLYMQMVNRLYTNAKNDKLSTALMS